MDQFREVTEAVLAIVSIVAILIGGYWAYAGFIRQRLSYPHADLNVSVASVNVPPDKHLVHVTIHIINSGSILLAPRYAELRLRQVLPIPEELLPAVQSGYELIATGQTELPWPMIDGREWNWKEKEIEIEPDESDTLNADFIIEASIQTIQLYCYVANPKKARPGLGWTKTILHSF